MRLRSFAGMVPRTARHLLQDTQAQVATNARLTSGSLEALHDLATVDIPGVVGIQSIFRIDNNGSNVFLAWDSDVNVVPSPIAGDLTKRHYYTGDNEPRVTNLALATAGSPEPFSFYVLGVFPPQTAPTNTHAGGAGAAISRQFIYTFVTPWGEESQPSPVSAAFTGKVDGTWTVGGMETTLDNTFTVTGSAWAAGIATLAVASTRGLRVGEEVSVAGMNPSGFNTAGSVITALDATHVSYAVAVNPGAFVAGGTISRIAPHNTSGMTKRIYWTETTVSGTKFQFVAEVSLATVSTGIAGNTISGEAIKTTTWEMPPVSMRGLTLHPSGAMVGFAGNQLYVSDVYKPYAYPTEFRLSFEYDIVGLGVFGTSVVVCTKGTPYVVSGTLPENFSPDTVRQPWPCLAKRGIVSFNSAVEFPTTHGLAHIGADGNILATEAVYKQREWDLLTPSSFIAAHNFGRYIASHTTSAGRRLIVLDKLEFSSVSEENYAVQAMFGDPQNGKLYVVIGDTIYEHDSVLASFIDFDWMSKEFVLPKPLNLGAAKVDADFSLTPEEIAAISAARAAVLASNQAIVTAGTYEAAMAQSEMGVLEIGGINLADLPSLPADSLQFQLWTDNKLRFTKNLTSAKAFVLPAGYKSDHLAVRITGRVKVSGIVLGQTMKDLEQS